MAEQAGRAAGIAKGAIAAGVILAITLVLSEFMFRIVQGVPVLSFPDYRLTRAITDKLSGLSEYDPLLGWRLKANVSYPGFHTLDQGVRSNGRGESGLRTGGVLVTGASFTAGSEVNDDQSWPSQFEVLAGIPVINASIGGFGTDQIILRAEQMLPVVKPRLVILDFVSNNILTAGQSYSGRPKPYFDVVNGALVARNAPVPAYVPQEGGPGQFLKGFLGYSFLAEMVMETYFPDFWFSSPTQNFVRAGNDEVDVTCRLLLRLKQRLDADGVRLMVSFEYGSGEATTATQKPGHVVLVESCAEAMGIQVVDEFADLRALHERDPEALKRHYMLQADGRTYGHKSPLGNLDVARRMAAALAEAPPQAKPGGWVPETVVPGDGRNLLVGSEALDRGHAGAAEATLASTKHFWQRLRTYTLTAAGNPGEHYAMLTTLGLKAGPYTVGLDIRADTTGHARVLMLDEADNGAEANLDLAAGTQAWTRMGTAHGVTAGMEGAGGDWYRVHISAVLPAGNPRLIVKLSSVKGDGHFPAAGEAVSFRALQLERGQSASPYRPSGK